MKTYIFTVTMILCFVFQPGIADNPDDDPLAESRVIRRGGGNEIITMNRGWDMISIEVFKFFEAMEITLSDTIISVLKFQTQVNYYYGASDLITLDTNGDGLSDIVAVWDNNGIIEITALRPDRNLLSIDTLAKWEKETKISISDPGLFEGDWFLPPLPFLRSGDFTGDGLDEFVVAYWAIDDQQQTWLYLALYDIDDDLVMTELARIMDQPLDIPPWVDGVEGLFNVMELTVGDFNGDGKDEILFVGRENRDPQGWNLFANVYSYDTDQGILERKLRDNIFSFPGTNYELVSLSLASGYLNSIDSEQAVVSFSQIPNPRMRPDTILVYMIPLVFNEDLSEITFSEPFHRADIEFWPHMGNQKFTLAAADINGNGFDEILSGLAKEQSLLCIYQLNDQLQFNEFANLDSVVSVEYLNGIGLGHVIIDPDGKPKSPELILTGYGFSRIYAFDIDNGGLYEGLTSIAAGTTSGYGGGLITTADLDGDIRLGTPKRSSITKILQPLIILNAPPIHFDVFDGINYDVSKMYNQNDPKFISSYRKETSQSKEVQTEFNKDWGISGTLSTSHSFFGVSVSSHLTTTYGEKFSKQEGSSTTVTVGISVDAIEDDRIYATVLDYNVWEYPVIGNGIERGHVLVVEPVAVENRWFPSKSWSGHAYVPEHEVGNILSYREYPLLSDNPAVAEKIKGDYNNSFVLDGNSSYDWSLQFDDFQSAGSTTQKEFGMDWGASIGGWGVKLEISGHYSSEQIRTQRTSVASGLFMGSSLRSLNMGLGEVSYRVTPYAYWAKNGALVIDYAVQPELAQPGGTPTWWQVHYSSKSDPAFILPWRYDPEKGFTLQDPAKRHQTKDITFFPEDPREGDLVTITARIHNFSLLPTPLPVGVSFYIGDPDNGGTLITGEGGVTKVHTSTAIPARGLRTVQMQWTVPAGIGSFPRIYGLIDPDQSINEIHDNNNKGWAILGKTDPVGVEEDVDHSIPVTFTLRQNYPNPFNPGTTIEFSIPKSGMVTLEVYNILGQKVATLVSEELFAGDHSYYWDAGRLASGMYIYRLQAGEFVESKKLLLMK